MKHETMLKERIKEDMKVAFKVGDTVVRGTLSLLLSVVQNRELEKRTKLMKAGSTAEAEVAEKSVLTDSEVIDVISGEIKKRKDAIEQYASAGRSELAASETAELAVLMRYMPEQMSEDEIRAIVDEAIASSGAITVKDIGKVMALVAPKTKGKADGSRVNEIVKSKLTANG